MPTPHRPNLTAVLAIVALAELVLHRLVNPLFLPAAPQTAIGRCLDATGRFLFHLGGVLAIVLVVSSLVGVFARREFFPRTMRFAVGIVSLSFVSFAALGVVWVPTPERFAIYLKMSHAFLAWFMVMALWRMPGAFRPKLAVTLFALPAVLQAAALFAQRAGWTVPLPGELARAAEICALFAGTLSAFLVGSYGVPGVRRLLGLATGAVVLGLAIAAFTFAFDLVQSVALYGFRLDIPRPSSVAGLPHLALVVTAVVGLATTLVWTLTATGPVRLFGLGLVLVIAAGHQALAPYQVLFATHGLLAMAIGVARFPAPSAAAD